MHLEAQERRSGPRNGPQAERLPGWGRSYLAPWYLVVARERKSPKASCFRCFYAVPRLWGGPDSGPTAHCERQRVDNR